GVKTARLKVLRCGTVSDFTKTIVVLAPTAAPTVDFTASRNNAVVNDTIRLLDISTQGPTTYEWTITPNSGFVFGNGTDANSRNPYLVFNQTGFYTVKFK